MKYLKKIFCFLLLIAIVYVPVWFAVVDENNSMRLTWHDFYCQKDIDVLAVGSSNVHCGFDPRVADELLGMNTFNLASGSQRYAGTYYILKEVFRNYSPKLVFFQLQYGSLIHGEGTDKLTYVITDFMKGPAKDEFIRENYSRERWPIFYSRVYRYRTEISPSFCMNNVLAKLHPSYWKYETQNPYYDNYRSYRGKGYFNGNIKANAGYDFFAYNKNPLNIIKIDRVKESAVSYIEKAVKLCNDNGAQVVFFSVPYSRMGIKYIGDYDEYAAYASALSERLGCRYLDLNLVEDDEFGDDEFKNLNHMTDDGAAHLTRVMCEMYLDEKSHPMASSIEDKKYEGIIGVSYDIEKNEDSTMLSWEILSGTDEKYSVCVVEKKDGELIFKSEPVYDNYSYNATNGAVTELEIYDESGNYMGNTLLKAAYTED